MWKHDTKTSPQVVHRYCKLKLQLVDYTDRRPVKTGG